MSVCIDRLRNINIDTSTQCNMYSLYSIILSEDLQLSCSSTAGLSYTVKRCQNLVGLTGGFSNHLSLHITLKGIL